MTTTRKPLALANWKMAMTITEGQAFVRDIQQHAATLLDSIELVICPPFTALAVLAQDVRHTPITLGGQNIAPTLDSARTGEISAPLLADVGCHWVMLGHWEIRRNLGDDDALINRKVCLACEAGLKPIILVGESYDDTRPLQTALDERLSAMLHGCTPDQVATMVFIYEPEGAIGKSAPVSSDHAREGCISIREHMRTHWGDQVAEQVRIIYGGSVTPEHAATLLQCMDGLGASTRGRNPRTFADIMQQIARVKLGTP